MQLNSTMEGCNGFDNLNMPTILEQAMERNDLQPNWFFHIVLDAPILILQISPFFFLVWTPQPTQVRPTRKSSLLILG